MIVMCELATAMTVETSVSKLYVTARETTDLNAGAKVTTLSQLLPSEWLPA